MGDPPSDQPIEIRYIGVNITPEVGADDNIISTRVVPAGRDGNVVLGRSLREGESDDDSPIVVRPNRGEVLRFPANSIVVTLRDADRSANPESHGYRSITNTIWTWLSIGCPTDAKLFRYLLAGARRLDGTQAVFQQTAELLSSIPEQGFVGIRTHVYRALSLAEIFVVAMGRSFDLLYGIKEHFAVQSSMPTSLEAKRSAIREMRNAFEHIEDRALGQVRGVAHPDALSVFNQTAFVNDGKLTYAEHAIDLREEAPSLLNDARRYIYDLAVEAAGEARSMAQPTEFFSATQPDGPAPDAD